MAANMAADFNENKYILLNKLQHESCLFFGLPLFIIE